MDMGFAKNNAATIISSERVLADLATSRLVQKIPPSSLSLDSMSASSYLVSERYTYIAEKTYNFPMPRYNWKTARVKRTKQWMPESTPQLIMGRWVFKVCSIDNRSSEPSAVTGWGVQIAYFFPLWMFIRIALVLSLFIEFDRRKRLFSVQLSLAFPAVVDSDSDVMRFAKVGYLAGLKKLFASGQARPTDTDIGGITPLHVSTNGGR